MLFSFINKTPQNILDDFKGMVGLNLLFVNMPYGYKMVIRSRYFGADQFENTKYCRTNNPVPVGPDEPGFEPWTPESVSEVMVRQIIEFFVF